MKKLLFLITTVLAIGATCAFAGCNAQSGPDANTERSYNIEQQNDDVQISEDDNDCKDGNCEDTLPDSLPEFNFKPHRHLNRHKGRNQERESVEDVDSDTDGDGEEEPIREHNEHVRPHKTHPNRNTPTPKPMPFRPHK